MTALGAPYVYADGLPGHALAETSIEAARAILPHAGPLERRALALLIAAGPDGFTDEELDRAAGTEITRTMRPRRVSLATATKKRPNPLVVDSGMRRKGRSGKSAVVWVAVTPGGQRVLL